MEKPKFAEYLALFLEQRGWSSVQLAQEIGVDPSYVRRLVAGSRVPQRKGGDLVHRISKALELDHEKQEALSSSLKSAIDAKAPVVDSGAADLAGLVERILNQSDPVELHRSQNSKWDRKIDARAMLVRDLATIVQHCAPHPSNPVYVFTAQDVMESPSLVNMLGLLSEQCSEVFHIVPNATPPRASMAIVESVLKIASTVSGPPTRYQPVAHDIAVSPSLISTRDRLIIVLRLYRSNHAFLALVLDDQRVCRYATHILQRLERTGQQLVSRFHEAEMPYQLELRSVDAHSTTRFGFFDEGLSFLTHPVSWYKGDESIESKVMWGKRDEAWKASYRRVLAERIAYATKFLTIEEVVSERSLLHYIRTGRQESDDFYHIPFTIAERKAHVSNLLALLRDRESRYHLWISDHIDGMTDNKSWAAYNEAVVFSKAVMGAHTSLIIHSKGVAEGFRVVFEDIKRRCTRRFPDRGATADWIAARAFELLS